MGEHGRILFKVATESAEFEQVLQLNHRTFAEEIPQHRVHPSGLLRDQFHEENTYVIARDGSDVVGMFALRAHRPFSLDTKLPDLDRYLPPHRSVCELRLLAVDPAYRNGFVFLGLCACMVRCCAELQHDLGVFSATTRQPKLYEHLGFVPFGPLVGIPPVLFQPAYVVYDEFTRRMKRLLARSATYPSR